MSTVNLNNLYAWGNKLINKLGQDIVPTNNENYLSFWADKVEYFKIWVNSRAITPENFMWSGRLLNLAKGLSQTHIATKFYDDPLNNIQQNYCNTLEDEPFV